ncbi:MAG TPA: nitroreductase family deazaflavin-dependent oxidoreductase [Blastocatellia bacterium]|nr:nitroreductase family deazaflavin-dependent oxidoreductase [Blastocatellia bacterium]
MFGQEFARVESEFYRSLNSVVEPLIRLGFANPLLWPTGAIVLEVTGRKTGQTIRVPLLATRVGDLFVVSTYRRRSDWVKNLAANPEARYWLGGRPYDATAFVLTRENQLSSLDNLPPRAACLAGLLKQQSQLFGISFAILAPRD